eukprot:CAMPEP_0202709590 /NCGR_PEP_ID=MMETSP1385-20130828/21685_1 /ASSEMBLY_ACC=CAM_ASM_000861 /TAXON_ID=933848 /ORGANISM="Elphidium margaritaceum" /LENGTH=404 /DNA_ID=CAMNT_0049368887 /DNA_START=33 /DNA_END=1247 /DNA_ORIENTATION=+
MTQSTNESVADNEADLEPFIARTPLTLAQRHQKYLDSLPLYDRILVKLEDWFKRRHISPSLVVIVVLLCALFIVFVASIVFIGIYHRKQPFLLPSESIASKRVNVHSMASSSSSSSTAADDNNSIAKRITVLLISDIHLNKSNVRKVHQYLSRSKIKIDHLWAPGDFLNMKDADNDDEKTLSEAETALMDLLQEISAIHATPIIIPGNHDPKTMFSTDQEKYRKMGQCINIHNQLHRVQGETNLFLAGFGGSVPAFCDGKLYWTGYPYADDDAFGAEYTPFIDALIKNKDIGENGSVVLFTHNGPALCGTTMDWRLNAANKVITTGSQHVTQSLLNEKLSGKVICNIHGHTHKGYGQSHIGDVRVINPGSLKGKDGDQNFALLELAQFKDSSWTVSSVQFVTLS